MKLPFLFAQDDSMSGAVGDTVGAVGDTVGNAASGTASMFSDLLGGITGAMGPQLGEFVPKLIGALVILVVGFIIAKIIGWIVSKVINKSGIGNKLSPLLGSATPTAVKGKKVKKSDVGSGFGVGAFWITMMFAAIAALQALGLEAVSAPISDLLTKFFEFIPNIIGAAAVAGVAFLVATIAKVGIGKGLAIADLDGKLKLAPGTLSGSLPLAAFCFIMLMALPAAFGALGISELSEPIQAIVDQITGFLPNLLGAGIIMGVFGLIAKLAGTLVSNLLGGTGFNKIPQHLGLMSDGAKMAASPSELAGKASMGAILLMGVSQAVGMLKLDVVSNVFNEVFSFAIPVVIGCVILAVGLWLANMARKAVTAGKKDAESTGNMVFTAVMVLSGIIALKRMGLAGELVDLGFGLALGGIALALALSFGLGGRQAAAKFLEQKLK